MESVSSMSTGVNSSEFTTRQDGYRQRTHRVQVPVDHDQAGAATDPEMLWVTAREFRHPDDDPDSEINAKPWLIYFQGGPGSPGQRPGTIGGWLAEALKTYRVMMLDQRGTGLSTPLNHHTLRARGDATAQADYLTHFRAPDIVADAEALRTGLGIEPWVSLGQSFGGFCTLSYLSFAPEGLCGSLITGGLAPLSGPADRVYRATYARMRARNQEYFDRYPEDLKVLARVYQRVRAGGIVLPDGSKLTVPRVQTLGMMLGGNTRVDTLHYVLEQAFIPGTDQLSDHFLHAVYEQVSRARNPLYLILHEAIYAQPDQAAEPTNWAAERMLREYPDFDAEVTQTPWLTGEMCYRWYTRTDPTLIPIAEATELIAQHTGWGRLYDLEQLAANQVPVAAAVYRDDVYVDRDLSLETAGRVAKLQVWETDAYHHDGIGQAGAKIFTRLQTMIHDR
ncbi:alpha/beta fold hydrolase [Auritidibacter ignavus]|uniref:alpha/beta fold hydrolase n=1 Tax=Auritidibacter ignavus TaxID=678932 RepID=UPI0016A94DE3|nr:alpha/beta fold hydrolase [Auritidibacter ignavus]NIH70708.1 pimeloyl-ACP methyl ester carboxylesterase [Auritidibacter ignavus]